MYAIKMEDDKSLNTTIHSTIYQGERNADTLVLVLPKHYEGRDMADCTLLLRYILPDNTGHSEELEMYPIPHNKEYNQYRLSAGSNFTARPGRITMWLTAVDFNDDVVLHTGETTVEITSHKAIEDFLPPEQVDQLDKIMVQLQTILDGGANGLSYDETTKMVQLLHNGAPLGDPVYIGPAEEPEQPTSPGEGEATDVPGGEQEVTSDEGR